MKVYRSLGQDHGEIYLAYRNGILKNWIETGDI